MSIKIARLIYWLVIALFFFVLAYQVWETRIIDPFAVLPLGMLCLCSVLAGFKELIE